jgi:hypothetical protein
VGGEDMVRPIGLLVIVAAIIIGSAVSVYAWKGGHGSIDRIGIIAIDHRL